jgi:hypothetical protein
MNLTKPTLKLLEATGYKCLNVETSDRFSKRKNDLLGFIDLLAFARPKAGSWGATVGIQVTDRGNRNKRYKKIQESPWALTWLNSGNGLLLITWSTEGIEPGDPRIEVIGYGDIENAKEQWKAQAAQSQLYFLAYNEGWADALAAAEDELPKKRRA